jgi:hypothetical protein
MGGSRGPHEQVKARMMATGRRTPNEVGTPRSRSPSAASACSEVSVDAAAAEINSPPPQRAELRKELDALEAYILNEKRRWEAEVIRRGLDPAAPAALREWMLADLKSKFAPPSARPRGKPGRAAAGESQLDGETGRAQAQTAEEEDEDEETEEEKEEEDTENEAVRTADLRSLARRGGVAPPGEREAAPAACHTAPGPEAKPQAAERAGKAEQSSPLDSAAVLAVLALSVALGALPAGPAATAVLAAALLVAFAPA